MSYTDDNYNTYISNLFIYCNKIFIIKLNNQGKSFLVTNLYIFLIVCNICHERNTFMIW